MKKKVFLLAFAAMLVFETTRVSAMGSAEYWPG